MNESTAHAGRSPAPAPLAPEAVAGRGGRLRRLFASFRLQLLWWFVAVLAIATVASVLLVRVVLLESVDSRVQAELAQEVQEVEELAGGVDPATSQPFGSR